MRYTIVLIVMAVFLAACTEKKPDEEADPARQKRLENMYKTPPASDRSKDKGF